MYIIYMYVIYVYIYILYIYNIYQKITKTVSISTRIAISYAIKQGIPF